MEQALIEFEGGFKEIGDEAGHGEWKQYILEVIHQPYQSGGDGKGYDPSDHAVKRNGLAALGLGLGLLHDAQCDVRKRV